MEGVVVGVCDGGGLMGDLGGTEGASEEAPPSSINMAHMDCQ